MCGYNLEHYGLSVNQLSNRHKIMHIMYVVVRGTTTNHIFKLVFILIMLLSWDYHYSQLV